MSENSSSKLKDLIESKEDSAMQISNRHSPLNLDGATTDLGNAENRTNHMKKRQVDGFVYRLSILLLVFIAAAKLHAEDSKIADLVWSELPNIPNEVGVAGPFVGTHGDSLLVAGGANFPLPVWETNKEWLDDVFALRRNGSGFAWKRIGQLPRKLAYGCAVSLDNGVLCIGGCDSSNHYREVFLIQIAPDGDSISITDYPPLPEPFAYGTAAILGGVVYVVGGQTTGDLASATCSVWALDLKTGSDSRVPKGWKQLPEMPAPSRAFHLLIADEKHEGGTLLLLSGRRQTGDGSMEFLRDTWKYSPRKNLWTRCADAPSCCMAGTGLSVSEGEALIFGGADGSLFHQSDALKDDHPGFPKTAYSYNLKSNEWGHAGSLPRNHVTTSAVWWENSIVIPSGEIRPRVRTSAVLRGFPKGKGEVESNQ